MNKEVYLFMEFSTITLTDSKPFWYLFHKLQMPEFMSLTFHSLGPNVASVKDFWRMVWEEDCGKIIMLTNMVEGDKVTTLVSSIYPPVAFLFICIISAYSMGFTLYAKEMYRVFLRSLPKGYELDWRFCREKRRLSCNHVTSLYYLFASFHRSKLLSCFVYIICFKWNTMAAIPSYIFSH